MMEKIVRQSLLFDFYGSLLTQHQQEVYCNAVFNDMSLSEVAEEYGISRQAAHDLIKRCDRIMEGYEYRLKIIEHYRKLQRLTEEARQALHYNDKETLEEIFSEMENLFS